MGRLRRMDGEDPYWIVRNAANATMAVVEAAGCESASDFLFTFAKSCSNAHDEGAPPFPFQFIVLAGDLPYKRLESIEKLEDVDFGVNGLLFYFDYADLHAQLQRTLLALASIPPFTTLVLLDFAITQSWDVRLRDAIFHALCSPNFCDLVLVDVTMPPDWRCRDVCNNSLRSLHYTEFSGACWDIVLETLILPSLRTSLTSLAVEESHISAEQIQKLFDSLEKSPRLTYLSLQGSDPGRDPVSWPRTAILDSLRWNALLHKVDLEGTPLDGDSAIAAQLKKNAGNAARIKALGSQGMERVRPSTVRLHLCGLPLSGKTTISRSLAKCSEGSISRFYSRRHTIKVSDRTRGIEVTTLENRQEQQRISLWDMAGQIEYHSFHDSMLPDLSDQATPPLFLYVWNPFEMDAQKKVSRVEERRIKSPDLFEADFRYWLKFISSKTLKSQSFKPKVIIVITRGDLGLPDMKEFLCSHLSALREEFKDYIHFDLEGFFQVDARSLKMIFELRSHLFKCSKIILEVARDDFKICDKARKVFTNLIHRKKISPLVSKARFAHLTRKHLGIVSQEMCEAVALSLSSSGDLIYFPSLDLVVVDTPWFCQKIMGDLLYFNMKSTNVAHSKGFFRAQMLQNLLEEEMNSSESNVFWTSVTKESLKVSGHELVKLLLGLRLACPEFYNEEDTRIFIPASLCGKPRDRIMPSQYFKVDESFKSYIGRRWAVKDSNCTFLTPGIFPLLQVTFHNILSNQKIQIKLDQDVMAFAFGGASVLVEFCRLEGSDNFIDVLVGSKHTVKEGLEWIDQNVTAPMKEVFSDSRGIPGVELVEFVIQPASIKALKDARERSYVPVEQLQSVMSKHVQIKGVDCFESVLYTWQGELFTNDPVVDLLGEVEVAKLVEAYRGSLREAAKDVLNLSDVDVEERTHQRQKPTFGTSPSQIQREAIYDLICDVRDDVKGDIERLALQVEDFRGVVLPKLHQMFTFVQEGEAGKLPRMFVVTQEVGNVRRVVAKVVPGLCNLQLDLLCECHNKAAHLVDGKRGLSITTLDDGLLKRGLPYINGFLKVAYVATKIGAHVAFGFGGAIPDFTRLLAGVLNTAECGSALTFSGMTDGYNSSSRVDFGKGQQWLFDVLSHHDCTKGDQIYEKFGLRRIRYTSSRVAWVCDKHYLEGEPFPA